MILSQPVTVNPPPITMRDGTVRTFAPRVITSLEVVLIDNSTRRTVHAHIRPITRRPLTLWEGDAYDAAGDYTQAQAEARILELLGPDITAGLEGLFVPPQRPQ